VALLASDHGASGVTHDDEHFTPIEGADAVFDLPDHVAAALLPFDGWREATDDDLPDGDDSDSDDGDSEDGDDLAAAPEKPKPARRRTRKTS
jgi:hypothetical protein